MNGKIVSSLDGLTLQLPSNSGLDYFKRRLYDQSVGFDLLELIFFDETLIINNFGLLYPTTYLLFVVGKYKRIV